MKRFGLTLSLLAALFAARASAANFIGFNSGTFHGIVGTVSVPTVPVALQVAFDAPVPASTFVQITSSDPSCLDIPGGGVTIPEGQSSGIVLVDSFALGTVTVTANFQDIVSTNHISVVSNIPVVLNIEQLSGEVRLTWTAAVDGYLLETNNVLTNPAGWGVLASNYNIVADNYVVTNAISGTQFYRLKKP